MVIFVLDTSALIRFVDNEAGADRIAEILGQQETGNARVLLSAVHWGEVVFIIAKRYGAESLPSSLATLKDLEIEVIPADEDRSARTALLRHKYKIPYADAFGVELASDSSDHILITADFDVKPAAQDIAIEFLPVKPKA